MVYVFIYIYIMGMQWSTAVGFKHFIHDEKDWAWLECDKSRLLAEYRSC